jgi:class 3 adenylate cyclase
MESFAKSRGADAVISDSLLQQLDLGKRYAAESLGTIELRGKQRPLELFALKRS